MESELKVSELLDVQTISINSSSPRPWVRFWARYFDVFLFSMLVGIIWTIIDMESLDRVHNTLLSVILMFSWIFVEGICLSFFGTTLGKKLFRIKIINSSGMRLTPLQSFKRSRLVWLRGMGLGIGIVVIIANILAFSRLKNDGKTTWDKDMDNIVIHEKLGVLRVCVVVLILIILFSLMILGQLEDRGII